MSLRVDSQFRTPQFSLPDRAVQELTDRMVETKRATLQNLCDYWALLGYPSHWEVFPAHDCRWAFAESIQELDLSCSSIHDAALHYFLLKFPNLKVLCLSDCDGMVGDGFKDLPLPFLEKLDLSRCKNLSDAGFFFLSLQNSVSVLKLSQCPKLTPIGMGYISRMQNLRELYLDHCVQLTDVFLAPLEECDNLILLSCAGCDRLTNFGMASIGKLHSLEILNLSSCLEITRDGLSYLPSELRILILDHCSQLENGCLEIISHLPFLEKVSLKGCNLITGVGVLNADFHPAVQVDFQPISPAKQIRTKGQSNGGYKSGPSYSSASASRAAKSE